MPIPTNKNTLLIAIKQTYSKLQQDLIDIPQNRATIVELDGHAKGTKMSIENLIAYLIGWGELVLKWNDKIEKNEKVDFPETNYSWVQLGELAQKFYKDYQNLNYPELLKKLDLTVQTILSLIESKTNSELYDSQWYKNYSMGRMIQLNTSSPYKNARSRIRKWKRTNQK